jgi:3-dehydroquinate dehydratase/shikimate dehydrogenase
VIRVKAANTLVRSGDDFSAYNTDFQAIIDTLRTYMPTSLPNRDAEPSKAIMAPPLPEPPQLQSRVVLVLGAGGIGRAVAHALHCTSVGMHPDMDDSPLHHSFLKPGLVVFDTVYTPESTRLVKEARSRGCHVITGAIARPACWRSCAACNGTLSPPAAASCCARATANCCARRGASCG